MSLLHIPSGVLQALRMLAFSLLNGIWTFILKILKVLFALAEILLVC